VQQLAPAPAAEGGLAETISFFGGAGKPLGVRSGLLYDSMKNAEFES